MRQIKEETFSKKLTKSFKGSGSSPEGCLEEKNLVEPPHLTTSEILTKF
jgi:hypothetical protein